MTISDEEALIRAREAAIGCCDTDPAIHAAVRNGERDYTMAIEAAKRALLDVGKEALDPLPVDRDLADLREIVATFLENDDAPSYAKDTRAGLYDAAAKLVLPTFRAIIQRRIEEGVEAWKKS